MVVVDLEDFPTPDGAVRPVAGAVQGDSQNGSRKTAFGNDRSDVSVVVLDGQAVGQTPVAFGRARGCILSGFGPLGAEVIGMEIVGDAFGLDFENPLEVCDGVLEGTERFQVLQVPDVLAEEGLAASNEAYRALELSSDTEHRREGLAQEDGDRNLAA